MHPEAADLIARLGLRRHPEGGWFRETYRSREKVHFETPYRTVERSAITSIYYLLEGDDVSVLHRIRSEEIWYFHAGAVLTIYAIDPAAVLSIHRLGDGGPGAAMFSAAIPAGTWFGARLEERDAWALVGCAVAPGFEFEDFEVAQRGVLLAAFPQHAPVIAALTRTGPA